MRSAVSCRWFRMVSALTKSPTGNTSLSKSVALANGIKDAHFVSRYSISGLVCPLSQLLIGRTVRGPSVWQAHRFHRGLGTSTRPNTVLTGVLPESLVVYRLRQLDKHVVAPTLRAPVGRLQNPARLPTTLCSPSNSCQAFPSPVPAARSSGPAGVVRPRRRLGKRPPPGPSWPQPPALCQLTQTRVGLFQAEPIRLQRSEFVHSSIDALKALVQHGAEQIPAPYRLTRADLG